MDADGSFSLGLTTTALPAAIAGGPEAGGLVNLPAVLIVFVAFVALVNVMLGGFVVGGEALTVERILGFVFAPVAWLIGVEWPQAGVAGWLLGVKLTLTEFVAFINLGQVPAEAMNERTRMLMTYALCGFANIGSAGFGSASGSAGPGGTAFVPAAMAAICASRLRLSAWCSCTW